MGGDLGKMVAVPGVRLSVAGFDVGEMRLAKVQDCGDVECEVIRGEWREPCDRGAENPDRRDKAASVVGVVGMLELLAKVDEGTSDLDETFVKFAVGPLGFEPEVFEDVVGFVVITTIEAMEKSEVAGVAVSRTAGDAKVGHEGGDAIGFLHGGAGFPSWTFWDWSGRAGRAGRMNPALG